MESQTAPNPEDQVADLETQCAILRKALKLGENEAIDYAALTECYSQWNAALFAAIAKYTGSDPDTRTPLGLGDRETVAQLASIGSYLTDQSYDAARRFRDANEEESQGSKA